MATRLRALMKSTGLGVRRCAERVGISASLVSSYLNGTRLPDAYTLHRIAQATGVSLDWLLDGEGGEGPVLRGQGRTPTELAADVGAHVARTVAPTMPEWLGAVTPAQFAVDGAAILERAAEQACEEFRVQCEAARRADDWRRYMKLARAAQLIALASEAESREPEVQEWLAQTAADAARSSELPLADWPSSLVRLPALEAQVAEFVAEAANLVLATRRGTLA